MMRGRAVGECVGNLRNAFATAVVKVLMVAAALWQLLFVQGRVGQEVVLAVVGVQQSSCCGCPSAGGCAPGSQPGCPSTSGTSDHP